MSNHNESRIVDADGDALLVKWGFGGGYAALVAIHGAHGEVLLDLAGIAATRAALDKAEAAYLARNDASIAACEDSACELSIFDRVFKTPACEAFDKAFDGSRYSTNIEVYEVCPRIRGAWQVVPATHKSK